MGLSVGARIQRGTPLQPPLQEKTQVVWLRIYVTQSQGTHLAAQGAGLHACTYYTMNKSLLLKRKTEDVEEQPWAARSPSCLQS